MKNLKKILYTLRHKVAYMKVEKQLTGKISFSGILHDMDKVVLLILGVNPKTVSKLHRKLSSHHSGTRPNYLAMIIDWECARITKPDKPLTARQTLYKYYPHLCMSIIPILNNLEL